MKQIDSESIDMIFCDLPYGKTKNKWDNIIPPESMWEQIERTLKDNGVVLFFGQDKFTAKMMLSNEKMHKYNIIWEKVLPSGFLNAKKQPLREHEDIMVFYNKQPTYNPQMTAGKPCHSKGKAVGKANDDILNNSNYGNFKVVETKGDMKYPTSVWKFSKPHPSVAIHPTQKPIDLCRYAIRTYTKDNSFENWEYGNIGFLASYNGRFFDGGYAKSGYEKLKNGGQRYRDYYRESKDNIISQNLEDIIFINDDYRNLKTTNSVIYCDPPYENQKQYANSLHFDYDEFWDCMRKWSENNIVLISELNAPEDFECIWEKFVSRSIKSTDKSRDTEKLFTYKNRTEPNLITKQKY